MRHSLVRLLRCPAGCEGPLTVDAAGPPETEVRTGTLRCETCAASYPIEEGIARMLPAPLRAAQAEAGVPGTGPDARKRREMQARDEQVGDYDRMWYLNLFGAVEVPVTMRFLGPQQSDVVLEAGCGTGRMTQAFAARCDRLVAADFSWESLRVNAAKLKAQGVANVDLVQADICHLPVQSGSVDRVVSCQVLEHIPTPECREAAVRDLARVLKADGVLALSAYKHSLPMRAFGRKEGEHPGGIPYYRFDHGELRALLSQALHVERMTGALVYHYLTRSRKR